MDRQHNNTDTTHETFVFDDGPEVVPEPWAAGVRLPYDPRDVPIRPDPADLLPVDPEAHKRITRVGHRLPEAPATDRLPPPRDTLPYVWTTTDAQGRVTLEVYPDAPTTTPRQRKQLQAAAPCGCGSSGPAPCCQPAGVLTWTSESGEPQRLTVPSLAGLRSLTTSALPSLFAPETLRELEPVLNPAESLDTFDPQTDWPSRESEGKGECPFEARPYTRAGRRDDRTGCCAIPEGDLPDNIPTLYVTAHPFFDPKTGRDAGKGTINSPVSIETAQSYLESHGVVHNNGLRILFRRGDTWQVGMDCTDGKTLASGRRYGLLRIFSSGRSGRPIILGAYTDENAPSDEPPHFRGPGDIQVRPDADIRIEQNGCPEEPRVRLGECATHEITRGECVGIRVSGAEWVQIQDLRITNFMDGIVIDSYPGGSNIPSAMQRVLGSRNITLSNLIIEENWNNGVMINSYISTWARNYADNLYKRPKTLPLLVPPVYGPYVVGDGHVWLEVTDVSGTYLLEIPTEEHKWWPELICVESCLLSANGDGASSSGVNLGIGGLAAKCTIRNNEIRGWRHSECWPNQCGRYVLGYECLPEDCTPEIACTWQSDPVDMALLTTWGVDGITMTVGGGGHIIENNLIHGHIFGQSAYNPAKCTTRPGNCGSDDGNAIDLKDVGNRTYWEDAPGGGRVLSDLPIVIRNNVMTENHAAAVILHFGLRNVHIYNNYIAYNWGNDGAAIRVQAGNAENALWKDDYTGGPMSDAGPARVEDLFIYRNVIVKNGYIRIGGADLDYADWLYAQYPRKEDCDEEEGTIEEGRGESAIVFDSPSSDYHGSYENVWLVHNTIAYNKGYGLAVRFDDVGADDSDYDFAGLFLYNNIYAFNTGVVFPGLTSRDGVQVYLRDQLSSTRGFLCALEMDYNCYYNPLGVNEAIVRTTDSSDTYVYSMNANPSFGTTGLQNTELCSASGVHVASNSIDSQPGFAAPKRNNFHLVENAPAMNAGGRIGLAHYETNLDVGFGPDIGYGFVTTLVPDIGADEFMGEAGWSEQNGGLIPLGTTRADGVEVDTVIPMDEEWF